MWEFLCRSSTAIDGALLTRVSALVRTIVLDHFPFIEMATPYVSAHIHATLHSGFLLQCFK